MPRQFLSANSAKHHAARQRSIVAETASKLRKLILRCLEQDRFLGSEDDLISQLGVSQPSFRQAARLLEYEELLVAKRGVGGGYFARRPGVEAVARMAGTYLLANGTPFVDVIATAQLLEKEVVRLITCLPDRTERQRLLDFAEAHMGDIDRTTADLIRTLQQFWRLACELTGSPSLGLFLLSAQAYGAFTTDSFLDAARCKETMATLHQLARTIADGDVAAAMRIWEGHSAQILHWASLSAKISG